MPDFTVMIKCGEQYVPVLLMDQIYTHPQADSVTVSTRLCPPALVCVLCVPAKWPISRVWPGVSYWVCSQLRGSGLKELEQIKSHPASLAVTSWGRHSQPLSASFHLTGIKSRTHVQSDGSDGSHSSLGAYTKKGTQTDTYTNGWSRRMNTLLFTADQWFI